MKKFPVWLHKISTYIKLFLPKVLIIDFRVALTHKPVSQCSHNMFFVLCHSETMLFTPVSCLKHFFLKHISTLGQVYHPYAMIS